MSVLDPKIMSEVDRYLDEHHQQFSELGRELFRAFGFDERRDRIAAQVRNLQQVVCSATRFADVEDFVKNQMGKTGNREWKEVGDRVLESLKQLRSESTKLASEPSVAMAVRLRLARGWVRAVVSEYLYQVAQKQMEGA